MRAVIFDVGRVLVHYNHQATLEAVAAISNVTTTELRALFSEIDQDLGLGNMSAADLHQFLIEHAGVTGDEARFLQAYGVGIARNEAALAYALELQARPDVTIGVISNTNQAHVLRLDDDVPELDELDLVIYSNEVGLLKPDPAIFELALELLEVEANQAIFVDDIAENAAAAQALGMAGIVHHDWALTRPALEAWLSA